VEDLGLTLRSAFAGKRVLVTGHTGFKGSWLTSWLRELGAEVTGVALAPDSPSHFEATEARRGIAHREVDVRDHAALSAALDEAAPEVVFHLAAQSLVRPSYEDPKGTFDVNVGGTLHVLEWARRSPSLRACVLVTSDKCYENREWPYAYREGDALGGHDPYSASKGAAEVVAASYVRSFFGPQGHRAGVATARAGNVIGGGDWAKDRIVADCVRALVGGTPIRLRNPGAVRPWQHVLEPLSGYLCLAARLLEEPIRFAQPYNFGPISSDACTVGELVNVFVERWGHGQIELAQPEGGPRLHEANLLRLACDKAHFELGWRPRLSVDEAIRWTVDWYRRWADGVHADDLRKLTLEQIRAYMEHPPR
jgi:CDP-glucose 4,6-dehydratase